MKWKKISLRFQVFGVSILIFLAAGIFLVTSPAATKPDPPVIVGRYLYNLDKSFLMGVYQGNKWTQVVRLKENPKSQTSGAFGAIRDIADSRDNESVIDFCAKSFITRDRRFSSGAIINEAPQSFFNQMLADGGCVYLSPKE